MYEPRKTQLDFSRVPLGSEESDLDERVELGAVEVQFDELMQLYRANGVSRNDYLVALAQVYAYLMPVFDDDEALSRDAMRQIENGRQGVPSPPGFELVLLNFATPRYMVARLVLSRAEYPDQ
ncbi:Hypothetical protein CGLY_11750 [Corynebacterium glyciniphilum AJ 3170]|uniref:Uncharacterized protein n=1 Tax=Corynebacterium glyciniphilum AJ 3170 TaxID=1404245 RepID=X5EBP9_9CORY|nr:hypothetical protein [Corynebacterium glyciniphilum]AHW64795.1 Hypothetical protein CGLY_11750 [Corynebacterium glyciniphilum AJ 3170]